MKNYYAVVAIPAPLSLTDLLTFDEMSPRYPSREVVFFSVSFSVYEDSKRRSFAILPRFASSSKHPYLRRSRVRKAAAAAVVEPVAR